MNQNYQPNAMHQMGQGRAMPPMQQPQMQQQVQQQVQQQLQLQQQQQAQSQQQQQQASQSSTQQPAVEAPEDPGSRVPLSLLNHLHLVVQSNIPPKQNLKPNDIVAYLHRAPTVLKDKQNAKCTVAWTMLNQPSDGTVLLMYQPKKMGTAFASDGIVWTRPEFSKSVDWQGFKLEVFVNEAGYIPVMENRTLHQRIRYRLLGKPASMSGEINPQIELVHYHPVKSDHQIPTDGLNLPTGVRKAYVQHQWLSSQGTFPKKEFMLDDRANWPTIEMPKRPRPARTYHSRSELARQEKTSKKLLQAAIATQQPDASQMDSVHQLVRRKHRQKPTARDRRRRLTTLKNEDLSQFGEELETLTPAEISSNRYTQHMNWMEEITSSPYMVLDIRPVNLTLTPLEEALRKVIEHSESELQSLEGKSAGQPETGRKAIKRARQQRLLTDLERQLAQTSSDQSLEDERIQRIISQFELATKTKITSREDTVQVKKGGLQSGDEEQPAQQTDEFADFTNFDTAGEALDMYETGDYQT